MNLRYSDASMPSAGSARLWLRPRRPRPTPMMALTSDVHALRLPRHGPCSVPGRACPLSRCRRAQLPPPDTRDGPPLPGNGRTPGDLPGAHAILRPAAPGVRGTRASGLPGMRDSALRLPAGSLSGLRPKPCRGLLLLSAVRNYEEFVAAGELLARSSHRWSPDSFWPASQAMSLSSTWNTPRRSCGGSVFSIALSFSVGSARR